MREPASLSFQWDNSPPTTRSDHQAIDCILEDAVDVTIAERFAFGLRLPPQIFWLLLELTLLGMAAWLSIGAPGPVGTDAGGVF